MSTGLTTTSVEINNTVGNLGRDLFNVYLRAKALNQRLSLFTDADLEATPIGYAPADVTALRGFQTLITQLCGILDGSGTLPAQATDYLQQLSPVIGIGI